MSIIMRTDASQNQIGDILQQIQDKGLRAHVFHGEERCVIYVMGDEWSFEQQHFSQLPGVDRVIKVTRPYKLASREFYPENSHILLDSLQIGGDEIVIFATLRSPENRASLLSTAQTLMNAGAQALCIEAPQEQSGFYPPEDDFHIADLNLLAEVHARVGLPVILEVTTNEQIEHAAPYVSMFEIGAMNMQNFSLLKAAGKSRLPILLKRGASATTEELLMAAEYILSHGNHQVVLCEGGIRTFENTSQDAATRNTTDINAIPVLRSLTHLPIILDPSDSTGYWKYVGAVARAGIAAGANGLAVEVDPASSTEHIQSLNLDQFAALVQQARAIAQAIRRKEG